MSAKQDRAMDPTQLLITVCALLGMAVVGVMAVFPTVLEAGAAAADRTLTA